MLSKIKLGLYHLVISKLPHSRMARTFNALRRWYASKVLGILAADQASFLARSVYIADAARTRIGKRCHINEDVFIQAANIGDNVVIGPQVAILATAGGPAGRVQDSTAVPIIADDVWIGRGAVILPGVTVARGSIVAAGAVVTEDIRPHSIVSGSPARIIRKRPAIRQTAVPAAA